MELSKTILDYHFFFKAFSAYISTNFLALGISSDQKDEIVGLFTAWLLVFDDYTNPNFHNNISIGDINVLYITDHAITEGVKTQIKSNPSIELSGVDYVNLGIARPKKPRSNVPAKDFAPTITLVSNTHLTTKIFAMDPNRIGKKGKPKDVESIGYKTAYTGADAVPPVAEDYRRQEPEGSTVFEILSVGDKEGKRLWVICYYLSPTHEAGPDSRPFSIVIV